jgi:hypothetical protein
MLDSEFDDMHGVDVLHDLEPFCLEADARETSEAESEADCDSVWLECNGELVDVGSVNLVGDRKSSCGFETLLFICPCCKEPHESIRFG